MRDETAVITSISPRNIQHQLACVGSWGDVAATIVSLNSHVEASVIRAEAHSFQPAIAFVETDRTAASFFGKPLIFIDSFLEWFLASPFERLIIVNSDILLSSPQRLRDLVGNNECDLLFGRRLDVQNFSENEGDLFDGFDYFVLSRSAASHYPKSLFCMGAPWWDHWMPLVQLALGRRVRMCEEPIVKHRIHENQWGLQTQIPLAVELSNKLVELFMQACRSGEPDPEKNSLLGLPSLFAEYFVMSREFYSFHYSQIAQYGNETQQALLHEICWRMPQMVLRYLFSVSPRCGDVVVGHAKEVPLRFR